MSKKVSIQFFMIQEALKDVPKGGKTVTAYKRAIKGFAVWAKEQGVHGVKELLENPRELIQRYSDALRRTYSASTVHSYLAPVCKACGIRMSEIEHPKRTAGRITRSRGDENQNKQGKREAEQDRFKRTVDFANAVGIRRSEMAQIRGDNLKRDESGWLCVEVKKGKGGKYQLQRILPENEEIVKSFFNGKHEKIFSKTELNNKIDYHAMRGGAARKAYQYYENRLMTEPGYRDQLSKELERRYDAFQPNSSPYAKKRFKRDMTACNGRYILRGETAMMAREHGRPTDYDRLAVLAVSVFHLSHWRNNVTVVNYLA